MRYIGQSFFRSKKFSSNKFVLGGFCFGLFFPIAAIVLDIFLHQFPIAFASVIRIHQVNPIHYIIDTAPWVLSATAYVIGHLVQNQEQIARQYITDSEKKFSQILQHNPDAVFLVRTSDFLIEQYNHMALRLLEITQESELDIYAPRFFTSLNDSLSILTKLKQEGDTFAAEKMLTTTEGKAFWGQVSIYTFSLHENNYQLIRIIDITPIKKRELELEEIKFELQHQSEELQSANEEITAINNNLEQLVKERTDLLRQRNEQLAKYAFLNAHKIRGPLARVLGSAYALEYTVNKEEERKFTQCIVESAKELDTVVHKMAETLAVTDDQRREEVINTIENDAPSA